ncbi:AraC family transcriptional regulator [Candidatus Stoquefichus massiliensis]|uniref:AraC family transcriptional regulator n=1 Tax=Candidatus Stoquefichus massiliensis TaxID=1470350 RepID=UPI0004876034|nr:AraC family transcriptional regulator [Candidatus Stoquefichus massiliensis]
MLQESILEKLVYFTDEEIDNLNGKNKVDRSIYLNDRSQIIDCYKILDQHQQIGVRKHARFIEYPKHKHNYIELMYVYGGEMTHIIDDQKIVLHEGELLLLNQNIEHSIEYCHENDIIFNFIIKPEFLEFLSMMMEHENDVFNFIFEALYSYENNGEYLVFKLQDNVLVKSYIESIITSLYVPQLNNSLELKLLVGLLLTELMNHPEYIETYQANSYEKLISSTILKYIATSYQEGSLVVLSEMLHLPDYKVCKIIRKQTGQTFKQLVQNERLKNAVHLLKNTHLPVTDIMLEVGYENITYFYKIFKNEFHMTPHVYRETYSSYAK